MRWHIRITFAVLGTALSGTILCVAHQSTRGQADTKADFILHAGRIWTGDAMQPWAESLAARQGAILAVGTRTEITPLAGPETKVLDLDGSFATPGLVDAHGHLASLGETFERVDLRDATSIEEVVRRVVARAGTLSEGAWLLGQSWDQSLWPGKELPTHQPLSRALPDHPVFLRRIDGHAGWANARAMQIAGVNSVTSDPPGGKILRDADGVPTGVVLDAALDIILKHIPAPGCGDIRRQLLAAQAMCLQVGLAGVHDAGLSSTEIELLRELDRSGQLKLRVYGMALPPGGHEVEFVSTPPPRAKLHDRFELRAIKMFIDGAMGSRGAALFEPYSDDPGNRGLILTEPRLLERITEAALENGWQVCTHAIGDRGNRLVLEAYAAALEKVPARDHRLRIEHAQLLALEDVPRFAELGVIASMQPTHATTDMRWAEARVGPDRIVGAYAWRRLLEQHARLAFGSDFPVERPDPVFGVYAAVTRQDLDGEPPGGWLPDQKLTIEEALRTFTAGSAYAAFSENHRGVLRVGMQCDVSIFDRDLSRIAHSDIPRTKVLATVIAGEIAFR